MARFERTAKKHKKQWIMKRYPHVITYQSALDTLYEPDHISVTSTDRLGEAFLTTDRQLRDGFSKLLICTILRRVSIKTTV